MGKKKIKSKIREMQMRICKANFLYLEQRLLSGKKLFINGRLVSMMDILSLKFLAAAIGYSSGLIVDGPSLNDFLNYARRKLKARRKKLKHRVK